MKKIGSILSLLALTLAASACSQHGGSTGATDSATQAPASTASASDPAHPALTADDNVWGKYLSDEGKLHGKDVQGHPYIYLIPDGDSPAANTRRTQELQSISFSIGPIVIPGSLLVLGGRDAQQTDQFAMTLTKSIKPKSLNNVVLLIVSDASQKDVLSKAYAPSGATVRVVSM